MKKMTLHIFMALFLTLSLSRVSAQTGNSAELKKIGSQLVECFYVVKMQSSIVLSGECTTIINNRISNLALALQTKIQNNKISLTKKLGLEDFKELENQVNNYLLMAEKMQTALTTEQRASMTLWISFSKTKVEELFIKLKK